MAEYLHIDVKQDDDSGSEKADRFAQKVKTRIGTECSRYDSCENEKILVYEYTKCGFLCDRLHKNNMEKNSSGINSWKMRIKIALDAARGIEYLHNYAVPPIIHRDIKSSNILLDANWAARVCDFGMSMLGVESESNCKPKKAVGTVGYIDPEFYSSNVLLTTKSDVYSLDAVLLELLTGKKSIFKDEDNGGAVTTLVDFAVPKILANELVKVLDDRIGPPELVKEAEAVELVAYTALHCVNLEGNNRPSTTNIANLEQASSPCDVRNEGLPIGAEQLHGRSNKEVANSNGTEKHQSEVSERQQ
ncbi:hypothetical protein P3X46_025740 [Hevea brasiliensis]|uniref:Protein kinase domain-containing protein n=1 Tax=Hevea brasiliensis TaxID=3981 RepID=A0ABQ9L6H9_HEVBR|nr:hypothetical protein P3X46_025740 [Hevea brasiliensis]